MTLGVSKLFFVKEQALWLSGQVFSVASTQLHPCHTKAAISNVQTNARGGCVPFRLFTDIGVGSPAAFGPSQPTCQPYPCGLFVCNLFLGHFLLIMTDLKVDLVLLLIRHMKTTFYMHLCLAYVLNLKKSPLGAPSTRRSEQALLKAWFC